MSNLAILVFLVTAISCTCIATKLEQQQPRISAFKKFVIGFCSFTICYILFTIIMPLQLQLFALMMSAQLAIFLMAIANVRLTSINLIVIAFLITAPGMSVFCVSKLW